MLLRLINSTAAENGQQRPNNVDQFHQVLAIDRPVLQKSKTLQQKFRDKTCNKSSFKACLELTQILGNVEFKPGYCTIKLNGLFLNKLMC